MGWMSSSMQSAVADAKARRQRDREQRREQRKRALREMKTAGRHKLEAIVFDEDEAEQLAMAEEEQDDDAGGTLSVSPLCFLRLQPLCATRCRHTWQVTRYH